MPIQLTRTCGRVLQAKPEHIGQRVRCPVCGHETTLPGVAEEAVRPAKAIPPARPASEEHLRSPLFALPGNSQNEDDEGPPKGVAPRTSGKAKASLVLGLLSFCFSFLAAVPAVILGILSLREIGRSRGGLKGKGAAIAGIITACLGMFVPILGQWQAKD